MSYSGTGANRTPLGRINPVLLGRKRQDDSEPSLLSHHLRNREQTQSTIGYGNYDQYPPQSQQYDHRESQQYDQHGQQNYDQRTPHYSQGGQQQYDQRGPNVNQYHQRSNQQYDHRGPQPYDRGNVPFEQRNTQSQHYDMRNNMQYDQSMPSGGHGYDQRGPSSLSGPPNQGYDMGQRGYQPPDNTQNAPQRGPPLPMALPPQPLMSANVGPPTPRSVAMPPQVGTPGSTGQNGILGMPPTLNQNYCSSGLPPAPQGQQRPEAPSSYSKDIKKEPQRDDSPARKKKKRSRWGDEEKKTSVPGMPATMPKNMTEEQTKQYLIHFKIEEIGMRLRTGDLGIPDNPEERSPSPEPIYNSEGKRLNTREFRVRKSLEEERHNLIQEAIKSNPDYKPPADYKPPSTRIQEKVMIPQDANPAINFIGLLIGPRYSSYHSQQFDQ